MSTSRQPTNNDEYNERFAKSQKITGFGLDTTMHVPCPFCAAPDWAEHKIMDMEKVMSNSATCKECGRSSKTIFKRDRNGVSFEIVQTGGADQPDWFEPKMRRVEEPKP